MLVSHPLLRILGVLVVLSILVALFLWQSVASWPANYSACLAAASAHPSPKPLTAEPTDPLSLPGWRENTTWVTADPDQQLQHWLQRMAKKEDGPHMKWARNKTILLLGDSVVRDFIWRLCDNHLHVPKKMVWLDAKVHNEKTQGWECVIPQTQTRLINGFIYGTFLSRINMMLCELTLLVRHDQLLAISFISSHLARMATRALEL